MAIMESWLGDMISPHIKMIWYLSILICAQSATDEIDLIAPYFFQVLCKSASKYRIAQAVCNIYEGNQYLQHYT
jgi:hypothetical protein